MDKQLLLCDNELIDFEHAKLASLSSTIHKY